ncbi:MAG: MarR family winged helix-turn-helix transcriptional regulator [Pseudanabaena sp.]|uniref:MarR family winged helix-turn-helix transcriptional regulator n=1 Tax=Pseudanabaena mucicola TaxID=71190 RepID=UPI0025758379|nr:MarR family transcriptional regulator [Pseudanabaena mucicola]MCA6586669.1 winged helix DNA-binding protein [Pseudanabaena sp. M051S1SP1A06QC]MCA6605734.1 winged helix DNA-binding protein [Pseudanabaena sp. M007S1SP1A06QC]
MVTTAILPSPSKLPHAIDHMPAARNKHGIVEQDPMLFQLMNEVGIVAQLAQNRASRLLAPDLNMSQFIVLNHFVRVGDDKSLSHLARVMEVTKGAMTNTMSRLESKGYIEIRPDPDDGRGKLARLTPDGRTARNRAVACLSQSLAPLASILSDTEMNAALLALCKARIWFDQNR